MPYFTTESVDPMARCTGPADPVPRHLLAEVVLLSVLMTPAYPIAGSGGLGLAPLSPVMLALGAVTYNISYAVFIGTAPFVATFLIAQTGNRRASVIYLTVIEAGALIATWLMPETRHRIMDDTQPHPIVPPASSPSAPPSGEKADARPAGTD